MADFDLATWVQMFVLFWVGAFAYYLGSAWWWRRDGRRKEDESWAGSELQPLTGAGRGGVGGSFVSVHETAPNIASRTYVPFGQSFSLREGPAPAPAKERSVPDTIGREQRTQFIQEAALIILAARKDVIITVREIDILGNVWRDIQDRGRDDR